MAAQKGRVLMFRLGEGESPETYTDACGIRERTFTISTNLVDTTTANCSSSGDKVEYKGEPGIVTLSFSGSGEDETGSFSNRAREVALGSLKPKGQVFVPNEGTYTGDVILTSFERTGGVEGTMDFSIEATFSGAITFEAV